MAEIVLFEFTFIADISFLIMLVLLKPEFKLLIVSSALAAVAACLLSNLATKLLV